MTPHVHSFFRSLAEWVAIIAISVLAMLCVRTFILEPYVVPTGSMESTIEIGDQVFAQKVTTNLNMAPTAGDIIVFRNPDGSSDHDVLVKRVIATAGQTVDFEDGKVVVDGQPLEESYTLGESWPLASVAPGTVVGYPYEVPEGCLWVMGDNRENSADSRYFGAISEDDVIGVVVLRYWPLNRFGSLS